MLVVVTERLEAVDRGLQVSLHTGVVGGVSALARLMENLREGFTTAAWACVLVRIETKFTGS